MQRVSYITDSPGKQLSIVIDMEVWSLFLNFHPDVLHFIGGNTFENTSPSHLNIFNGEVINPIAAKDFPTEPGEKKN